MTKILLSLTAAAVLATGLMAAEEPVKKKKQTVLKLYLTPKEAYDMKEKNPKKVMFVDVRTPEELYFVGHAADIDYNIPFKYVDYDKFNKKKKGFASHKNKDLVKEFDEAIKEKGLTKNDPIIVICRSGDRSGMTVNELAKAGYTKVYTVVTGTEGDKDKTTGKRTVNGWKNDKLPWNYKFNPEYFKFIMPKK